MLPENNYLRNNCSSISDEPSPIRNLEHPFAMKTRIDQCKRRFQIGERVLPIADRRAVTPAGNTP
jgi:hypothetical protein